MMRTGWGRVAGWRLALAVGLAVATLVLSLHGAGPALPMSTTSAQAAPKTLEGVWLVQIDPTDPGSLRLVSMAPDGLMYANEAPTRPLAPGEGPPGVARTYSSQGYGVWSSTGGQTYAFKFLEVSYDDAETTLAVVTIAGTLTLDASGDAFAGTYTVTLTPPGGSPMTVVPATPLAGTRVSLTSTP